ncbi:MAG TPA: penicillin-binding protein 2 [Pseudonocardia sp.]|nr:penicillin-binding protein 2 [Pseudonocardia sp.]
MRGAVTRARPARAARSAPPPRTRPARTPPRRPRGGPGSVSRRLRAGRIVLTAVLALAAVKLVAVQTVQAGELSAASERQRLTDIRLPAERGSILDRAGYPLAFSVKSAAIVANPRLLAQVKGPDAPAYAQEVAGAVAAATGADPAALLELLTSDRGYAVLASRVDPDVATALQERFPELTSEARESREYPGGTLAANIVGAARWDAENQKLTGLEGLESSQDNLLSGTPGLRVVDTAEGSATVIPGSTRFERPAVPGSDLELTIDSDLQFTVQRLLGEEVTRTGAKGGSAVVLDAATGEVRALANDAVFDPRDLASATPEQLGNPAVSTPFEPGSVAKVVTIAAALEHGVATPDRVLAVPGSIRVADRTVSDAWNHPTERYTVTGVLAKSSNVGTIMLAREVGEDRFAQMLGRFGLGARTGVGLPGESSGQVPSRETWSGSTFGNLPIGQGLSTTVLQMAGMYQAVANDGVRIPPRIIAGTRAPDGTRAAAPPPEPVRVVSPETARELRTMLTAVTQDVRGQRGTGPEAAVPGYQVAGKTGTAQQVDPACGCYAPSTYWITFAGMFPAEDPRYVIGIMLDAPGGGSSAAPLFGDIASYLAQREQLPVSAEPPPVQTLVAP